ncbi:hypothetical protein NZK35_14990 [Stieleria sp. ICT_E10.1]|uniref:hypothetical protein n=1 Tax=Stieleria sedimenti TaxID=2976331 RepID=UPI0021804B95|nr:hypothetical protein [Stieleria sedimenti]MCS7467958.1 hypothetical protein [Stieleria sedimenti]
MIALLKSLQQKWNDWCGDREMELEIRKHLTQNGYYGGSAKLKNVRLIAVQRPGWLQVFRFEATARLQADETEGPDPEAVYENLYGLVRDDIRHKTNSVRVFQDPSERRELFLRWSEDLIQLRGAQGLVDP